MKTQEPVVTDEPTAEEKKGMKMIQFLQKQVNIDESDQDALVGWRKMSASEKNLTERAYKAMGGAQLD